MDTSASPTGVAAGVPVGRWTIDPGNSAAEFANAKRNRDLRGHRLLDTEQFPDLTFTATEVRANEDGWLLTGSMTAHGATIPLTLDVTLTTGPTNGQFTVHATTTFDRRDLGIKAPRLVIGHDVRIQIDAQFRTWE